MLRQKIYDNQVNFASTKIIGDKYGELQKSNDSYTTTVLPEAIVGENLNSLVELTEERSVYIFLKDTINIGLEMKHDDNLHKHT